MQQPAIRLVGLLLITWLFGATACSGLITVVPISTPAPTPPTSSQAVPTSFAAAGGGAPTRMVIEAIDLDAPVVEMGWQVVEQGGRAVSVWNVPDDEAGWHLNSARPGEESNVVISGHNNSSGGHIFGKLEELEVGDQIKVWTGSDESYMYQISETQIIRAFNASPENLEYLRAVIQPTDQAQLTLITCWPSWTNTHRLIIVAHPS